MNYRLEYESGVLRSIERLPRKLQKRILDKIGSLATDPRPLGSIKLANQEAYRIRVGDYRIIYTIFDDRLVVLVIDVGHRRDVYRR
jgi:mRNA interferase RelE/StbE